MEGGTGRGGGSDYAEEEITQKYLHNRHVLSIFTPRLSNQEALVKDHFKVRSHQNSNTMCFKKWFDLSQERPFTYFIFETVFFLPEIVLLQCLVSKISNHLIDQDDFNHT